MRGLVVFLVALGISISFIFLVSSIKNQNIENKEENKKFEFRTYTSAVCEDKRDAVHCRDEVFVNCNGKISKVIDIVDCNGIKLDVPKASGFAVFEKGWKDTRE